ncbi:sialate O-acetylesterase [Granulicella sp. 5B5]|uniref:sialate O-acetylesterase n=1 Tax=Granulicella sp. 5B5 TaxID=1617967 RepID=UPI0015F3EB16|nr:sialate O-acetylesterase [Granulicella sp. 5B5]QMV18135.1 sialate O-acetylesterase [Granulicella sp. 5B5]
MRLAVLAAALCFAAVPTLHAELRLPNALSDHAVLQRDRPIHIWGWATPGAHLTAHFHGQTVLAVANDLGQFNLYLTPEHAGGPYTLTLSGDGPEKTLTDLLVGDVWLASGQSNMEFPLAGFTGAPLKDMAHEIAAANNPKLRLLRVDHKTSDFPVNDVSGTWKLCTPETAKDFSAVAYFFGRAIAAHEDVPIGLIDSTWGGTPADSWTSLDTLGTDPALLPAFASRARFANEQTDLDATIAAEKQADAAAKAAGKPAPTHPWHPFGDSWFPASLYNGMIAPLTPLTIRGFLWYQGETNSALDRAPYYGSLFSALIGDWRAHFAQGNLPFLYVQISSFNSPSEDWGTVRDAQRRTLAVANTAMATTLDIGLAGNVHPPDKQTVAARLVLGARDLAYGEHIPDSGPLFRQATTELSSDGRISLRVWFDHADGLSTHGSPLNGFEIAGADHHFIPAEAKIEGDTIVVSAPSISKPVYVRYGWMGVVTGWLYNADGLPAPTFTSEQNLLR